MKKSYFLFALFQTIALASCAVYQAPNAGDRQFWHEYNVKYLKRILATEKPTKVARNVILFIGDGMSFATIAAGRVLKGQMQGKSGEETEANFESFSHLGLSKTYNTNSQVPDSAATATAIYSGVKTTIRTVGLNNPTPHAKESERLKTIIDWAQEKGKRTGVVTTTR
jgi:alkaline phosphatase